MRGPRLLVEDGHFDRPSVLYHCFTRTVDKIHFFGDPEKKILCDLLDRHVGFTGCRPVTFSMMSNHIHLLLDVPPMPESGLSDAQLLDRLKYLYSEAEISVVRGKLKAAEKIKDEARRRQARGKIHARYTYRMHDLSFFMKGYLQHAAETINAQLGREGTLWDGRFKNTAVEKGLSAWLVAAYIDLNPVRAKLVANPSEYEWSGYGQASKKNANACAGLGYMLSEPAGGGGKENESAKQLKARCCKVWKGPLGGEYRRLLQAVTMVEGNEMEPDAVTNLKGLGWHAGMARMLRQRVRSFTYGGVIGSNAFVNKVLGQARGLLGLQRREALRPAGAAAEAAGAMWSLRAVRDETASARDGPPP